MSGYVKTVNNAMTTEHGSVPKMDHCPLPLVLIDLQCFIAHFSPPPRGDKVCTNTGNCVVFNLILILYSMTISTIRAPRGT